MGHSRRVVITGMGVVTSLGESLRSVLGGARAPAAAVSGR